VRLPAQYECNIPKCTADFNADGIAGVVTFDNHRPQAPESYPGWQRSLVVVDSGTELLRIPFTYADGSLRTHAAIRPNKAGARLIVFDPDPVGKPIRQVFAWNGTAMIEVTPTHEDINILSALAAHDDAGTARLWALYRTLRIPILLLYCTVILCLGVYMLSKKGKRPTVPGIVYQKDEKA
jgi:hypothetical protein